MAGPDDYVVLVTDQNCSVLGDPITCFTQLDVTLKFNEPGAAITTVPAYPWVREQLGAGNRIVIVRAGQVLIAGPIEETLLERSDDKENAGVGMLTINSSDDLAKVVARVVYGDPANAVTAQTVDNWTYTGVAGTGIWQLINTQAGPGAIAARRVPNLVMATDTGAGSSITAKADRQQALGDLARAMATAGTTELGFRTKQVGSQIVAEVYQPPDKSGLVRFGWGLGNLKYLSFQVSAPTATAVSVGGQGDGADRAMIERTNASELASWGRFEKHVARPGTDDLTSLQDDGDSALADGAATTRLATNVADTPDQQFGIHYFLGDKVAVETFPGEQYADLVRTVHLQVFATAGEVVSPYVGSQAALSDPAWIRKMQEIEARLARTEMSVLPSS